MPTSAGGCSSAVGCGSGTTVTDAITDAITGTSGASRAVERAFWRLIAQGASSEVAAAQVGVSAPVGSRWFRHAGGMSPISLVEPTGWYLSLPSGRRSPSCVVQDHGVREIARRIGRDPSTVSRELRRNAATGAIGGSISRA